VPGADGRDRGRRAVGGDALGFEDGGARFDLVEPVLGGGHRAAHHAAAVGAGGIDRRVERELEQRVAVERRPERLADAPDRLVLARALGPQRPEPTVGLGDPHAAVVGEDEQAGGREEDEHPADVAVTAGGGGEVAQRPEQGVDALDDPDDAVLAIGPDPAADPLAQDDGRRIGRRLGGEGGDVDERRVRAPVVGSGERQDGGSAQRVPAVGDRAKQDARRRCAADDTGQRAGEQPGDDERRHGARRQQEEHRDEHELGRDRVGRPDVEADRRGDGVGEDEERPRTRLGDPVVRGDEREGGRQRDEQQRAADLGDRLAPFHDGRLGGIELVEQILGGGQR